MSTALVPIEALPGVPDTDDLPDTVIAPPGTIEPLPGVTLDSLMDGLRAVSRALDGAFDKLPAYLETHAATLGSSLHGVLRSIPPEGAAALEHLCTALDAVLGTATTPGKGVQVTGANYRAAVTAITPGGYGMTLTIERQEGAEFFAALAGLEAWLKANQYTSPPTTIAF